jgi:hypothetical protein
VLLVAAKVAVYTDHWHHAGVMRRVLLRMSCWMNYGFLEHQVPICAVELCDARPVRRDGGVSILMLSPTVSQPSDVHQVYFRSTGLLPLKMPRAIPAVTGRSRRQPVDALDEHH